MSEHLFKGQRIGYMSLSTSSAFNRVLRRTGRFVLQIAQRPPDNIGASHGCSRTSLSFCWQSAARSHEHNRCKSIPTQLFVQARREHVCATGDPDNTNLCIFSVLFRGPPRPPDAMPLFARTALQHARCRPKVCCRKCCGPDRAAQGTSKVNTTHPPCVPGMPRWGSLDWGSPETGSSRPTCRIRTSRRDEAEFEGP